MGNQFCKDTGNVVKYSYQMRCIRRMKPLLALSSQGRLHSDRAETLGIAAAQGKLRITGVGKGAAMFSYVSLGTSDLARAIAFYDAVLAPLGHSRIVENDPDATSAAWGLDDPGPHLWVTLPFDGRASTVGNGTMVSFLAASRAAVDAFHAAALSQGGLDEGGPGLRPQYGASFYAAYLRDPDGNKLNAVCYVDVAVG